jgi:hypothetical protein
MQRLTNVPAMGCQLLCSAALTGTLAPAWGDLVNLQELTLSRNQLAGRLPASWGTLRWLLKARLDFNRLSGQLPEEWQGMTALQLLWLGHNQFAGGVSLIRGIGQRHGRGGESQRCVHPPVRPAKQQRLQLGANKSPRWDSSTRVHGPPPQGRHHFHWYECHQVTDVRVVIDNACCACFEAMAHWVAQKRPMESSPLPLCLCHCPHRGLAPATPTALHPPTPNPAPDLPVFLPLPLPLSGRNPA